MNTKGEQGGIKGYVSSGRIPSAGQGPEPQHSRHRLQPFFLIRGSAPSAVGRSAHTTHSSPTRTGALRKLI